jgi:hypothetical protein
MKRIAALIVFAGLGWGQSTTTPLTSQQLTAIQQAKAALQAAIATYEAALAAITGPVTVTACIGGTTTISTARIVGNNLVTTSQTQACVSASPAQPVPAKQ